MTSMDASRPTIGSAGWLAHYRIKDIYLMRIAVISNYATNLWLFRRSLLEEMVAQGHEVMACAPDFDDNLKARLTALGVTCQPIELRRNGLNPLEDVDYLRRLRALLKAFGPDLTLAYAMKPVIYGSLVAWSLGVKKRFSLVTGLGYAFGGASLRQRLLNGLVNRLFRLAFVTNDRVFVQNPDDAALFVDQSLLPSSKLVVVNGSGVPLHDFEQAPLPEGPTIFLFIARLMAEKGILEFVDAARHLKSTYPHARFQILGPFPFDDIASAVKPEQLHGWIDEGVVEYLGETDDVRPFIRNAHVFVLPSYYREGTPRSALEAMAMGRPIITTDRPGCRETVIDGENGFLVPAKDPRRLAEAMQRFIDAPERLSLASAASRRLAEDKYDVRKVNRTMLAAMGLLPMDGHEDARPAETPAGWGVGADGLTESLKAS